MSEKLSTAQLSEIFVADLGERLVSYSPVEDKPIDIDLKSPMRPVRVYLYNLTKPPGGRSENEYKIQLIVPGQARGSRGNFDDSDSERFIIMAGYEQFFGVWVLWDAYLYQDFSWSRNVQIQAITLITANTRGIGEQTRQLKSGTEVVIACSRKNLAFAIQRRFDMWVRAKIEKIS